MPAVTGAGSSLPRKKYLSIVAWLGGRGVNFMSVQPSVIGGLLIGTVIGVAFFRGVPVGPLIAAGIVSLFVAAK